MTSDFVKEYYEFASNLSFFEFLQEEFGGKLIEKEDYEVEIKNLSEKEVWNIEELSALLSSHPRVFDVLEAILQFRRFTNTQLVHFLFDVNKLNSTDIEITCPYLIYNLKNDEYFYSLFIDILSDFFKENPTSGIFASLPVIMNLIDVPKGQKSLLGERIDIHLIKKLNEITKQKDKEILIFLFKKIVVKYINKISTKIEFIHKRITNKNFSDIPTRISVYLINNYHLNNILTGLKVNEYLIGKRKVLDTKGIHGKFGHLKIHQILDDSGFVNIDNDLKELKIKSIKKQLTKDNRIKAYRNSYTYTTEKFCEGIRKKIEGKLKKFDFVLLYNLEPRIVIETNFYSTSGTKIGINQGEYIALDEEILTSRTEIDFYWITDGNYWLLPDGKERFVNLKSYFGKRLQNYNLFRKNIKQIKTKMKYPDK